MSRRELGVSDEYNAINRLTYGPNNDWLDVLADFQDRITRVLSKRSDKPRVDSIEEVIEISGHPRV